MKQQQQQRQQQQPIHGVADCTAKPVRFALSFQASQPRLMKQEKKRKTSLTVETHVDTASHVTASHVMAGHSTSCHGHTSASHGKSRVATANHGKSRQVTASHGNSRQATEVPIWLLNEKTELTELLCIWNN
jgi:hypothetical protein